MRMLATMVAAAFLVACGGGGKAGGGSGQAGLAADACDAYAKDQLADKAYQLDKAELAKSMVAAPDGSLSLKSLIVIEPGTKDESKQTLECSVRFVAGKEAPDVLKMQFIWQ